jgi:hypothetical protein
MTYIRRLPLVAGLLLAGTAACVDLDVQNPNAPDAAQALRTAGDVEALIAGTYREWWNSQWSNASMGPILSVQSFQHSAFPANFGMTMYSTFPREQIVNDPAHGFYNQWANPWTWNYRAIAAARDGLLALDEGRVEMAAADEQRARAFARFMQGLAHATLATLFDQAFVVDESVDTKQTLQAQPAAEVLAAALGYFDDAIELAQGAGFTIPETWMSKPVTAAELVRLAHSYKAMYRAAVARTPEERQAVDWDAVIADVDAGVTSDWAMKIENSNWGAFGVGWYVHSISAAGAGLWSQMSYFVLGMADQSGRYQRWLAYPLGDRHPNLGSDAGDPFIIETPDERFPQGSTLAAQRAAPGTYYRAAAATGMWGQPGRGTWRWSWYLSHRFLPWFTSFAANPDYPWVSAAGLRLLKAEGRYHKGDRAGAAELINVTRTANGLNATDAAGTNTSCVPKLPDGSCGDLFEMLKWEKRIETVGQGLFGAPWYFDGRGWEDLYEGTQLEFPVPCRESQVLILDCYTFGGVGGPRAAPQSRYSYPGE